MACRGFSAPRQGTVQLYLNIDIDNAYFNDIVIREIKRGIFIVMQIFMIFSLLFKNECH